MISFLKNRATHLTERMDDPDCDKQELFNTYDQFAHLNKLISRWKSIFLAYIAPLASSKRELQILDIGCGGGDLCLKFAEWADEERLSVRITGIDPDPRAMEYINKLTIPENVEFRNLKASELIRYGEKYDVVVSNHLLHHLRDHEIQQLCKESELLGRHLIIFNDIRRSKTGLTLFGVSAPIIYKSSFIVRDGITSIRRSFTKPELQRIVPEGWKVKKLFPWRLLLMYEVKSLK